MTTNLHFDRLQCPLCEHRYRTIEKLHRHMRTMGHTPVYLAASLEQARLQAMMKEYHLEKEKQSASTR